MRITLDIIEDSYDTDLYDELILSSVGNKMYLKIEDREIAVDKVSFIKAVTALIED